MKTNILKSMKRELTQQLCTHAVLSMHMACSLRRDFVLQKPYAEASAELKTKFTMSSTINTRKRKLSYVNYKCDNLY